MSVVGVPSYSCYLYLKLQTRVLVTHGITYLPKMDLIITMNDGEVSEMGTYDELMENDGAFADFMQVYLNDKSQDCDEEDFESKF